MNRALYSFVLIVLCTPFSTEISAQSKTEADSSQDLYAVALGATLKEMEKSWGEIDDSADKKSLRTNFRHMVVEASPAITDNLPTQFGDFHLEYLDARALRDRYEQLGKRFSILEIRPMKVWGARLTITISRPWVSYKRKKFMYEYGDWSTVEFHFDPGKQTFTLNSVTLGGI